MIRVLRPSCGPRLYVGGLRVHHGVSGAAMALYGAVSGRPRITALGVFLLVHDRADLPRWFTLERLP